jgi:hypothetical protein
MVEVCVSSIDSFVFVLCSVLEVAEKQISLIFEILYGFAVSRVNSRLAIITL